MKLQQSHIGEKMRNKLNIDMIMYILQYSHTSNEFTTVTHRGENKKQNEY